MTRATRRALDADLPLFATLDNTVAVNADPTPEAQASVSCRGDDLREAYAHGRALLHGRHDGDE
jgi:hypothetical protein